MSHHLHRRGDDPAPLPAPPIPMTEEQLDFFTEQTEHAADKAAKSTIRVAGRAYVLLVLALVLVSAWYSNYQTEKAADAARVSQTSLREAAFGSCHRVNVLRAQSNLSDLVIFNILSNAGRRELSLARTDIPSNREAHKNSARNLLRQASRVTITGLTDCNKAVGDPLGYKVPLGTPIGDAGSGTVFEHVAKIIRDSEDVFRTEQLKP